MRTHGFTAAAMVAASFLVVGCTPDAGVERVTSLRVAVDVTSAAEQVTRVTLSARSNADTYAFELAPGSASGHWTGGGEVKPGEYYLQAQGFDAGGVLLYEGYAGSYLVSHGSTTLVAVTAQSLKPPITFGNTPPRITALYVSSLEVDPGGAIRLIVAANDVDPGSTLTYSWSAPEGSFDDPTSPRTLWTAPDDDAIVSFQVSVTDEKGARAEASFAVTVGTPVGEIVANVSFNSPPDVFLVTATPTRVDVFQPAYLSVEASDPDGDELSYYWWSSCPGWFDFAYGPAPIFYAYGTAPDGRCDVHVQVSEPRGGYGSGRTVIWIGPAPAAKVLPTHVVNGSFETGDYAGWTVSQPFGFPSDVTQGIASAGQTVANGDWVFDFADQLWTPQWSPGLPITFAPSDGDRLAFVLGNGPGRTRMYQDLEIPPGTTRLAWDMAYTNHHGVIVPNQQGFSVNVRDLASDAIVGGIYGLAVDAAPAIGMTTFEADLSAWAGQAIRLNFTVHQLLNHFDVAIDDVRLQ